MDISFNQELWIRRDGARFKTERGADSADATRTRFNWPGPDQHTRDPGARDGANPDRQNPDRRHPDRPVLDWQGLAARLSAAYALSRLLAEEGAQGDAASGSFHEEAASTIATYGAARPEPIPETNRRAVEAMRKSQTSPAGDCDQWGWSSEVNPVASADRKGASGIHAGVAGDHASGDRGLI